MSGTPDTEAWKVLSHPQNVLFSGRARCLSRSSRLYCGMIRSASFPRKVCLNQALWRSRLVDALSRSGSETACPRSLLKDAISNPSVRFRMISTLRWGKWYRRCWDVRHRKGSLPNSAR